MRVLHKGVLLSCCGTLLLAASAVPANGQQQTGGIEPSFTLQIGKRLAKLDAHRVALSGQIGRERSGDPEEAARITAGSLWLPRGIALSPRRVPICGPLELRFYVGIDGCPDGSILGEARSGTAFAEVDGFTDADYVFVNTGPERILAFMTIYNPAIVQEKVALEIHKLRGKKWSYRLDFRFSKSLMVIAGVPVKLRSFDIELDGIERAPGYLTLDRRCPKRGHFAYRSSLTFLNHDGTTSESSRRARLKCWGLRG